MVINPADLGKMLVVYTRGREGVKGGGHFSGSEAGICFMKNMYLGDFFQSISLEKSDVKHVSNMLLIILMSSMSCFQPLVVFVDVDGVVHDVKSG